MAEESKEKRTEEKKRKKKRKPRRRRRKDRKICLSVSQTDDHSKIINDNKWRGRLDNGMGGRICLWVRNGWKALSVYSLSEAGRKKERNISCLSDVCSISHGKRKRKRRRKKENEGGK